MYLAKYQMLYFLFCFLLSGIIRTNAQPSSVVQLVTDEGHPYFGTIRMKQDIAGKIAFPFQVFPQPPKNSMPPMLGQFERADGWLYFRPRFPFIQGRSYWIRVLATDFPEEKNTFSIDIPILRDQSPPQLLGIYPSGGDWPSNQLKIYLSFDQPMRGGRALQYVKLFDEQGEEIKAPFLDIGQELWDATQQRLTIWFDPGRIKTGLIPNQKYGPPLQADQAYQLRISKEWLAANGLKMTEDVVKHFRTGNKDQTKPNPDSWRIRAPEAASLNPLIIYFPEPLDYALLHTALLVVDQNDIPVKGFFSIGLLEKSWQWLPETSWKPGLYKIKIHKDLEDLAGNNLERLFDSIGEQRTSTKESDIFEIEIYIK